MKEDEKKAVDCACYEVYTAWKSKPVLLQKLKEMDMLTLYKDIELPLVFVLYDMENEGIRADGIKLKEYGDKLAVSITELEKKIYEAAGEEFNINSPKQLGVILFEKLGLPNERRQRPVILLRQMCSKSWHRSIRLSRIYWNTDSSQS